MATEKTDVVIVGRRRGGRHSRGRARQSRHEGDRARARAAPDDRGLQPARRIALLPAPGSAPEHQTPARHLAAERECAREPDAGAEQRQPGRRRHRALRRGLVAHARGRFPCALAHHRALRSVRDPGGLLARRLAVELRRSRALLRPSRIRARRVGQGRQSAGQEDRRRQRVRSTAPSRISAAAVAAWSRPGSCSTPPGRSSAITRSRPRAPSSRSRIKAGRAAPIAASARPSAAMSARSRRSSSPSCRRPTRPATSSSSPAPWLSRQQRQQRPGDRRRPITVPTARTTRSRPRSSS